MSPPKLLMILTPSLAICLALVLIGVIIYYEIRVRKIKIGVNELEKGLRNATTKTTLSDFPITVRGDKEIDRLARTSLNLVTEAELDKQSSSGVRKVQSVLLDVVKDVLLIVDQNEEIRYANKAARIFFGKGQDKDIEGRQLIEVTRDHHFAETIDLALETGGPIQDQFTVDRGTKVLFIEAGQVDPEYKIGNGAWLMVRDVTTEVQTEQMRKDFVANASHELRTPLSIIRGYLEVLEDDATHAHAVALMMKHTDRLNRIVDDMLMISRIESTDGRELENKEVFDISDCVYDTIEQLQPMIADQKAELKVTLPPEKHHREIYGDRFYWDQILFNLVENALKQNPQPGLHIEVVVEKEEVTGRFRIEVIDNGVGIPTSDLSEIFKRFYRVEKSHSQQIKGTGLGLSIVKRAVEAHHGTISVTSQPWKRTCFSISIPGPPVKTSETAI